MPSDTLTFRLGETKRIAHQIAADEAFAVGNVSITVWDSAGTEAVAAGTAGGKSSAATGTEHEVYYLWTPATAGDFTYRLLYTVDTETKAITGAVTVLPATSKFDPYAQRISRALSESEIGDAQAELSFRDLMDAVNSAVREYSNSNPRRVQVSISLTAAQWEYPLSGLTSWVNEFSEIVSLEPDVDPTIQSQFFLKDSEWYVDEVRATPVWGFVNRSPSTGETARITYKAVHSVSHTLTTLPSKDFEGIALFAAGVAAETALASLAARTEAPQQGAEIISRRDQTARWQSQAKALKALGKRLWSRQEFYL